MTIFGIDTSSKACSCALTKDGQLLSENVMNLGLTHSQTLMPAVDALYAQAQLSPADTDLFAVVTGPGSFTGVRIGVCTVKALCLALNKPCAAIDALEALAMNFYGFDGLCCPILDARRGQVYCAAFDMKNGMPERVLPGDAIALEDFLGRLPEDRRLMFAGDGVPAHGAKVKAILGERAMIAPENLRDIRADAACVLAGHELCRAVQDAAGVPVLLE